MLLKSRTGPLLLNLKKVVTIPVREGLIKINQMVINVY